MDTGCRHRRDEYTAAPTVPVPPPKTRLNAIQCFGVFFFFFLFVFFPPFSGLRPPRPLRPSDSPSVPSDFFLVASRRVALAAYPPLRRSARIRAKKFGGDNRECRRKTARTERAEGGRRRFEFGGERREQRVARSSPATAAAPSAPSAARPADLP